ncbi:MAG TPA: hypothetical protein VFU47_12730 [Armatimonadota bacterium]|nr:hypothetical protein [Armatimonadota bacterium]
MVAREVSVVEDRLLAARDLHGVTVEVAAEDPRLLAAALRELPPHPAGPAPPAIRLRLGARPIPPPPAPLRQGALGLDYLQRYPGVWLRTRSGTLFHADLRAGWGQVEIAARHWDAAGPELHSGFVLLLRYLLREAGLYSLHASGVTLGASAVLLAGPGGSGKSTTAALLARGGAGLLADDLLLLREDPGGIRALPFEVPLALHRDVLDRVAARAVPGAAAPWARAGAHPRLLLFPRVGPGEETRARPLPRAEALRRLIACSFLLGGRETAAEHLRLLAALARQVRSFDLLLGRDFEALPGLVRSLLARA